MAAPATTDRAIAVATSAVLPRLRRIVIGVDLRAPSLAAVVWCARVLAPNAALTLVHTYADAGSGAVAEHRTRAVRRLQAVRESLFGTAVRIDVTEGDPAERIAVVAAATEADLVVVDTAVLHDLHRARVGIGAVFRRTPCSVPVVDGPTIG